jgi:hypothetical protein
MRKPKVVLSRVVSVILCILTSVQNRRIYGSLDYCRPFVRNKSTTASEESDILRAAVGCLAPHSLKNGWVMNTLPCYAATGLVSSAFFAPLGHQLTCN